MKVFIHVDALTGQSETVTLKSRRCKVLNTADIQETLNKIAGGYWTPDWKCPSQEIKCTHYTNNQNNNSLW